MKHNLGVIDGAVRWVLAVFLLAMSVMLYAEPVMALLAASVALALIATALLRTCPVYAILGISTNQHVPAPKRG